MGSIWPSMSRYGTSGRRFGQTTSRSAFKHGIRHRQHYEVAGVKAPLTGAALGRTLVSASSLPCDKCLFDFSDAQHYQRRWGGDNSTQKNEPDVSFWHLADIPPAPTNVRYRG
jgi:hypothetical protein